MILAPTDPIGHRPKTAVPSLPHTLTRATERNSPSAHGRGVSPARPGWPDKEEGGTARLALWIPSHSWLATKGHEPAVTTEPSIRRAFVT